MRTARNDTYVLDSATMSWEKPKVEGNLPTERIGHTVASMMHERPSDHTERSQSDGGLRYAFFRPYLVESSS